MGSIQSQLKYYIKNGGFLVKYIVYIHPTLTKRINYIYKVVLDYKTQDDRGTRSPLPSKYNTVYYDKLILKRDVHMAYLVFG